MARDSIPHFEELQMLLTIMTAMSVDAKAEELEVLLYDTSSSYYVLAEEWSSPADEVWPKVYQAFGTGTFMVSKETYEHGAKFCVDFRRSETSDWSTTCLAVDDGMTGTVVQSTDEEADLNVGLRLNLAESFTPGIDFGPNTVGGLDATACAAVCDDGSSCGVTCPGKSCTAKCSPSAECSCV